MPRDLAGPCFIGFAIGESLGAAALRIGGGIFTKIADIGSDLMKIVFNLPEDDPKNPGVIADCTGDNAGDSVGPTADGFETYGVTGVALVSFLALSLGGMIETQGVCGQLIIWIFVIQSLMVTGIVGFLLRQQNRSVHSLYNNKRMSIGKQPLTNLVWLTSIVSIVVASSPASSCWRDNNGCNGRGRTQVCQTYGGCWLASSPAALWPDRSSWNSPKSLSAPSRASRERNRHLLGSGRASLNMSVRFRHRQFLRVLDGAGNHRADVRAYIFLKTQLCSRSCLNNSNSPRRSSPSASWPSAFWQWRQSSSPWTVSAPSPGQRTVIYELSRIESVPNVRAEIERISGSSRLLKTPV